MKITVIKLFAFLSVVGAFAKDDAALTNCQKEEAEAAFEEYVYEYNEPICDADGKYKRERCSDYLMLCECVDPDTGVSYAATDWSSGHQTTRNGQLVEGPALTCEELAEQR